MNEIVKVNNVIFGGDHFPIPSHMNFGRFLVEKLSQLKSKDALINGVTGEKISYGDLADQIVKVASGLSKLGVKQGDVVAICSENRIEFFVSTIAAFYLGTIATFLNTAYTKDEIIHTTKISQPKYVFLSPDAYKLHYDTLKNHSTVQKFIIYGDIQTGELSYSQLVSSGNADVAPVNFYGRVHTALILYSSGTTGMPKGARITHLSFIVTSYQAPLTTRNILILSIAPWCNTMGILMSTDSLMYDKTVVFLQKFDEKVYLQTIQKYKVGVLLIPPPILIVLSKSTILDKFDVSSVELIHSGGAPLDTDVISLVKARFPNLRNVTQGYGMTETTGAITKELDIAPKQGSVGRIAAGIILKVADVETRKVLSANQPGEICAKGLVLFDGYIGKKPEEDFDEDGFFKTGDIGYYDDDGYFFIIDRIKELIKYKAWQVSPAELEAVCLLHPAVKDVGVVGTPDPEAGELPTAFVVKKPESNLSDKELIAFVATKVSPWKRLRGGVIFVDAIPKTGSGKILRRKLRELVPKKVVSKL